MIPPRRARSAYGALQGRMIEETELALLYGLRFPDRMPRIPTMEVGTGRFHPVFAANFWQEALELDEDEYEALDRLCFRLAQVRSSG